MHRFIISDLVMENASIKEAEKGLEDTEEGYFVKKYGNVKVERIVIKNDSERKKYGCEIGRHVTVYVPESWNASKEIITETATVVGREISKAVLYATGRAISKEAVFVVAGVGNSAITPDSIGPLTVNKITVTRHVEKIAPEEFKRMGICSVCAVNCGVLGETGIETFELLKGITEKISPDCVIAVDALATRSSGNIGRVIQISDAGITPGAGIGNRQCAVNKKSLGVPVIALGVPTVVSAATLICDTLQNIGFLYNESVFERVKKEMDMFVTPKECDLICNNISEMLAKALDIAFGVI